MLDEWTELATLASKGLYATPSLLATQKIERVNVNLPTALRAPVEGPGNLGAREARWTSWRTRLGVDPARSAHFLNHADADPGERQALSSKVSLEAYEAGAEMFGWRSRPREPACDGDWFVGTGMATCTMGNFRHPAEARVRLRSDATAVIEASTQDIGTGTLTIFPQIAADALGLPSERVLLTMGDSSLPGSGPDIRIFGDDGGRLRHPRWRRKTCGAGLRGSRICRRTKRRWWTAASVAAAARPG